MGKFTTKHRASEATYCLEQVWQELRRSVPGLPHAALIPLDVTGRRSRNGHFSADGWRKRTGHMHEIAVSPFLFGKPADLLCTLIHEAAHALLHEEDPENPRHHGGCSRNDRYYHRTEFRKRAEDLGLECSFLNGRYGWAKTEWPAGAVPETFRPLLGIIRKHMPVGAEASRTQVRKRIPASLLTLHCNCEIPRALKVRESVWKAGEILCTVCNHHFTA